MENIYLVKLSVVPPRTEGIAGILIMLSILISKENRAAGWPLVEKCLEVQCVL